MNTQISLIIISFLFTLIQISFGVEETCKSGQTNCQSSKVLSFDESKLYYIKNPNGYLCINKGVFSLGDPKKQLNNCLFKFRYTEYGYYTIQMFATDEYITTENKGFQDSQSQTFNTFKFVLLNNGWYEVICRLTSNFWELKINSNNKYVYYTSQRTQETNQSFRVEEYQE
ncbi:unnamed protein product [Paramecium sonneborni]|uniref:Transmembrane protein n=1 Tax=Paramecium sonneborni TaxID=65129 RepID=A0A8S1QEF6_9CILI|nr:unnamed protein product [Paramecium sonneborni]